MMKDDWAGSETDEYSNNLQQRTEELYRIPDADQDSEGLIECSAFIMRDMLVYPRMISPIFIAPGPNSLSVQDAQLGEETMIGLVQQNPEIDEPTPEDFLPIGIEVFPHRDLVPDHAGGRGGVLRGREQPGRAQQQAAQQDILHGSFLLACSATGWFGYSLETLR